MCPQQGLLFDADQISIVIVPGRSEQYTGQCILCYTKTVEPSIRGIKACRTRKMAMIRDTHFRASLLRLLVANETLFEGYRWTPHSAAMATDGRSPQCVVVDSVHRLTAAKFRNLSSPLVPIETHSFHGLL